jgi:hypothetical protein
MLSWILDGFHYLATVSTLSFPALDHHLPIRSPSQDLTITRERKMSFLLLLGQATATFLVSFIIGYLPLVLRSLSANKGEDGKVVKGVSVVGMGLLVGSALTIIIPEYVVLMCFLWISFDSFPIPRIPVTTFSYPSTLPIHQSFQTPQNSVRGIPMEEG